MTSFRFVLPNVVRLLGVAVGAATLACGGSRDEVARVTDPTGALDAVLVETNGGATTSFGYVAYVVPHGEPFTKGERVAHLYAAARSDSAYGADLRWAGPRDLRVEYQTARIANLDDPTVTVSDRAVRVQLDSGVVDPAAPSGGMLWNRQGRPQ